MLTLLIPFLGFAQTPYTVAASGLPSPIGLEFDSRGKLFITENGTGTRNGGVSILNANGTVTRIVAGLASIADPVVEGIKGPWHTQMLPNNQLAVVVGEALTEPNSGQVLVFDMNGFTPGTSAPKTAAQSIRQIKILDHFLGSGSRESNPYSMALDGSNNIYVVDAAANAIAKVTPNGTISTLVTFPDIPNPTPVGPPMINQVPTRIIANPMGGFYVSIYTGFPFPTGRALIYKMTEGGVLTPFATGLSNINELATDPNTGELYALQHGSFAVPAGYAPSSARILRIKPDGTNQVVATGFGLAAGMAIDKMGNIFVCEYIAGRVLKFSHGSVETSTAFFNENFNRGIPSTWSSVDSTGGSTKFVACDSTCLKDYDTRYTSGFYNYVNFLDDNENGIGWASFKSGSAALKAFRKTGINATLTSPAINCSGKNKVFLRFATVVWGGSNADSVYATSNAVSTCRLRISRDGRTWTDYKIFDFNIRIGQPMFLDISDIAANQSRIFIQFKRTGNQDNQIWAVDDVSLFDTAPLCNMTVSVDMSSQRVSPKGVYLANDLKGNWQPNAVKMKDMGSGIYAATMQVPQSTTAHYKFMNGDSWGENESVPSGCGEMNAAGFYDRVATGYNEGYEIPTVCFGACMSCGKRQPQSPYTYCPPDPNLIYCENFEAMQHGKLVPQVSNWSTYSLAFNGYTNPMTAPDNPQVTGFWNGFTNFDGSHALKISSDPILQTAEDAVMHLGNPTEGSYQLDFKVYMPKNRGGMISIDDADGFNGFTMDFSGDSLYLLSNIDFSSTDLNFMRSAVTYKQDDWNDVSLSFNAATNKIQLKLNNLQILNAVDAAQTGYKYLEFFAADYLTNFASTGEFYIDDIVYKRVPPLAEPPVVDTHPTIANATVSPNPANEKLLVTPDQRTTEDWQVRLINQLGQVIETQRGSASTPIEFNTMDYQSGIYVVDFQSETTKWTKKVMIKH